jgi:hypothetical protein
LSLWHHYGITTSIASTFLRHFDTFNQAVHDYFKRIGAQKEVTTKLVNALIADDEGLERAANHYNVGKSKQSKQSKFLWVGLLLYGFTDDAL